MARKQKTIRENIFNYLEKDSSRVITKDSVRKIKSLRNSDEEVVMRTVRRLHSNGELSRINRGEYTL